MGAVGSSVSMMVGRVELRAADAAEFPEFHRRMAMCMGEDVHDSDQEMLARVFEPERGIAGVEAGRIVATSALAGRELAVPGGVVAPAAAGMMASVAPTHRRRGLLTAMKRRQLETLYEQRREPVVMSWPSEAGIYGRFGYGLATAQASLSGETPRMRVRPDLTGDGFGLSEATLDQARPVIASLYERLWRSRPGWLGRGGGWWDLRFYDPEHRRGGGTARRVVLCQDSSGAVRGYAMYSVRYDWDAEPNNEVEVFEIAAERPGAYAATWRFLLELDLVRRVRWRFAPAGEPLRHMVADPRAVRLESRDGLWLRLVDVGRALAARRYSRDVDVVLDVEDRVCEWNAGRWRLSGGPAGAVCRRTAGSADIALTAAELAAAYLGGTSLASLAAAGRVSERRAGALNAASQAFLADPEPWCPEDF